MEILTKLLWSNTYLPRLIDNQWNIDNQFHGEIFDPKCEHLNSGYLDLRCWTCFRHWFASLILRDYNKGIT